MSTIVTRDQSGIGPIPANVSRNITPEGITAHYGGGSVWNGTIGSHDRCASIWRAWRDYHVNHNGWADIAYTSGVCPHGYVFDGRGAGRRTAANGTNDGNQRSYAVVYIAGDGDPLTEEAKAAFHDESNRLGQPLRWGHREWLSTGCPGSIVWAWREAGFPLGTAPQPSPAPPSPAPGPTPQPAPTPGSAAPPFPLQPGWYFGPKSGPKESVSGFYSRRANGQPGNDGLAKWQQRMSDRGWNITVDGLYGDGTAQVASGFQHEKGLTIDGKIGSGTWAAAWTSPVT